MTKNTKSTPVFIITCMILLSLFSCEKKDDNNFDTINDTIIESNDTTLPSGWNKVGTLSVSDMIWSITSDKSGNIYVAGNFTNSSGYHYVAKWDGTSWSDINLNANGSIYALTSDITGNVYAVGEFTDGATTDGGNRYVAKWNRASWNNIGRYYSSIILAADSVGNVYNANSKWDGSQWSIVCPLCSLSVSGVLTLTALSSGKIIYAGGSFALSNGYRYVAKCDGSECWSQLGDLNANANIEAIVADNNGNVYAAGDFTNGLLSTVGKHYVAKWNGSSWSDLGKLNANDDICNLAIDKKNGYIYASGYFGYVARWNGSSWNDLGNMGLAPTPIYVDDDGKLYSVVALMVNGKSEFCVVVHD